MYVMKVDPGFRALANPARRELLRLVRDRDCPVGELAESIGASQPATSQHLAILREACLVTVTVDGRRRLYRANVQSLAEMRAFFDGYWSESLDRLADAAAQTVAARQEAS